MGKRQVDNLLVSANLEFGGKRLARREIGRRGELQPQRLRLRGSNRAIKTVMRWTGASERTVKGWLSGTSGPSGEHLIALLRNSDTLLERVLRLAGRGSLVERRRLEALKNTMAQAVATIEALLEER